MSLKIIRDAVHGDLPFSEPELRLIDTATFQRLRGIKQLGTSSLVYPSATHTRFEHSLGTCAMAKRVLAAVEENGGSPLDAETKRVAAAAALVHDVTHVPFGHTFEDERRVFERHDRSQERLRHFLQDSDLGEELDRQGLGEPVRAVLSPADDSRRELATQVVSGAICADLLDYLRRDAQCCGLSQDYDDRLFRYFACDGQQLVLNLRRRGLFRPDALSELVNLLRLRYNLTERVYYHHGKVAAGAMISKALELCLRAGKVSEEDLLDRRDDSFLDLLARRGTDLPGVPELLADLRRRRLVRRVYCQTLEQPGQSGVSPAAQRQLERLYHLNEGGARERAEAELESRLGVAPGTLILYCPSAAMALKEAHVLISLSEGETTMLSELKHPEVEVLLYKHRALWRFYVFIRRGHEALYGKAAEACVELIGHPNLLTSQARGELTFSRA